MRRLIYSILILVLGLYPFCSEGQVYQTKTGYAEFHSEVPLHSFTGTSEHLVGRVSLADSTVDFYLDLNTLDTGIDKRDKDMKETLETEKYPFAEFFGTLTSGFDTTSTQPQKVTVKGDFGIHGVTRQLDITGTMQLTEQGLKVNTSWTLNIENYDIEPPGILFYRVDENQDIEIEATLTKIEE